jgi:hypothetical protein
MLNGLDRNTCKEVCHLSYEHCWWSC